MFTLYALLKFVHVVSVIVWVGGVVTLTILNMRLARARSGEALAAFSSAAAFYGQAVAGPAAGITLLAGIATALSAGFQLNVLWIIWGFAAIVLSIALGATAIRVTTQRLNELASTLNAEPARVAALQGRLVTLNAINLLLLLSAVWAMVAKPTL
jgi:uncharacterized membrane protein